MGRTIRMSGGGHLKKMKSVLTQGETPPEVLIPGADSTASDVTIGEEQSTIMRKSDMRVNPIPDAATAESELKDDDFPTCRDWTPPKTKLVILFTSLDNRSAGRQELIVNYYHFENGWLHYHKVGSPENTQVHLPAWRIKEVTAITDV